ncbi:hypothetical protein CLV62_13211 [Dysgonomonas alginatilytica]|uniref:HPt domain-containing protein n=1 Tax=Dysgonomonas alginatilytica TaxID=1605892 RepID=A0A2V3PLD9_9BACT|nr:hypothetical protein [Dysgonomonas alginatilytica]PXV60023.1 hypothetical protein CLV62_13211 [Dysgonomonas alginatilytica]
MEYISINEKDLIELYGGSDNEMVDKMMSLMLEQTFPKITSFLSSGKEESIASKVDFFSNFISSFSMVGLSAISAKIELIDEKVKNNTDYLLINEAILNLEESISQSEILIKEYRENIKKTK